MKFYSGLGVVFVLAGASLMLPRVTFGAACQTPMALVSQPITEINYVVGENPNGAPGPGTTESGVSCSIPQINFSTSYDLLQSTRTDSLASDTIRLLGNGLSGQSASTTVTFTSDPGEVVEGTLSRLTATPCAPRTPLPTIPDADCAQVEAGLGNSFVLGTDASLRTVILTVTSDLDAAAVPEPSTGLLLLGSVLPAALGIWRFGPRRSA